MLDLTVLDVEGQPHTLGSLTGKKPAVLIFLRHFG